MMNQQRRFALAGTLPGAVAAVLLCMPPASAAPPRPPLQAAGQRQSLGSMGAGSGGMQQMAAGQRQQQQQSVRLVGTVKNLSTGASFVLQGRSGRTINVVLNASTKVTSGQTGSAATLANDQSVVVAGILDSTTNTITAASVTLNNYKVVVNAQASGTVASVDAAAGTLVVTFETFQSAGGYQPTGSAITVQTNAATRVIKGQQQGSLSNVAIGDTVEVGGSFDTTTQTLTAKLVFLR